MHRCWTIPEILDMMFSPLEPWGVSGSHSAALAALARTCRRFQSPALDLLWKQQYSLANFLKCMPADLFWFDTGENGDQTMRLLRPIMERDWDRPQIYAHRVNHLYLYPSFPGVSFSTIFPALSMSLPSDCLFPNLQTLHWHYPATDFQYLRLFLTPPLDVLSISYENSTSHLSILSILPRKCPALKHVYMYGSGPIHSDATTSLCTFMDKLPHLETIKLREPNPATFLHIGRMERLKCVEFMNLLPEFPSPPTDVLLFPNVQEIELDDVRFESATKFFTLCANPSLDSVSVCFVTYARTPVMNDFVASLAACRHSHLSLTTLRLMIGVDDVEPADMLNANPYLITLHTLRLLFCFKNLTVLSLVALGFDLDDSNIAEIARSLPRLRTLKFAAYSHAIHPRATLNCLLFLAQHCRCLESLSITLDASNSPIPDNRIPLHMQTTLTFLDVGSSPIATPLAVARFISAVFPCLVHIWSGRHEDFDDGPQIEDTVEQMEYQDRWYEVQCQIPIVRAIREEGSNWSGKLLSRSCPGSVPTASGIQTIPTPPSE
ncbi:hypothetical protein B0H19DRAFT_1224629 [Mycena capillaripes]|nr:hypothetical protein B0H19DRAFT_1224629 [Mycena capillaripes]